MVNRLTLWAAALATSLPVLVNAQQAFIETTVPAPWVAEMRGVRFADLDGNGVAEVIVFQNATVGVISPELRVSWNAGAAPATLGTPAAAVFAGASIAGSGDLTDYLFGDFDGDGDQDVLVAMNRNTAAAGAWYVVPQIAPQTFGAPYAVLTNVPWMRGVAGDFNGDGRTDLAAMRNNVTGPAFYGVICTSAVSGLWPIVAALNFPVSQLAVGDFNGDGIRDLVYSGASAIGPMTLNFHLGGPTVAAVGIPIGLASAVQLTNTTFAVGDLNGDGLSDVAYDLFGAIGISFGTLPAGPIPPITVPAGPVVIGQTTRFVIGDFDGAGAPDIGVLEFGGAFASPNATATLTVTTAIERGGGVFGPALTTKWISAPVPTYDGPAPAADLDGDGDFDSLTALTGAGGTAFYFCENRARYGAAVAGGTGLPQITASPAFVGAPAFTVGLANATPGALAVLLFSIAEAPSPIPGILVDIAPTSLLLPNDQFIAGQVTPGGTGTFTTPIPAAPALAGVAVYAQWVMLDPLGQASFGGVNLASTAARRIAIE